MTFTVTYRAKDGALREEVVEAAGRSPSRGEARPPSRSVQGQDKTREDR